jgi:AraC-like DNA-binding protein
MFDQLPGVSFFAKNRQFKLMCANRHFIETMGFTDESSLVGKDDFDLFPPRLAENFRRDDEEIFRTGEAKLNIVELFFNPQGIPDWFITHKMPLRDRRGRLVGIMGMTQSYGQAMTAVHASQAIEQSLAYIRENFRRKLGVEELAAHVHLSPRQLHRKFVEAFGCSPQAFIMKLRIQAACEALQHEDAQISQVALDLGFYDQSGFTQHFHRHVGVTPLKYQRRFRLRVRGG